MISRNMHCPCSSCANSILTQSKDTSSGGKETVKTLLEKQQEEEAEFLNLSEIDNVVK